MEILEPSWASLRLFYRLKGFYFESHMGEGSRRFGLLKIFKALIEATGGDQGQPLARWGTSFQGLWETRLIKPSKTEPPGKRHRKWRRKMWGREERTVHWKRPDPPESERFKVFIERTDGR